MSAPIRPAEGFTRAEARASHTGTRGAGLDRRVTYPCYKSFDEFIDVSRLRSLDAPLTGRIGRHGREDERMILLTEPARPSDYHDPGRAGLWRPTRAAREFPKLMEFVATLPFEATGRIYVMYDAGPRCVPPHQDHLDTGVCHEFIWRRTSMEKPLYMMNERTGEKLYVSSYSAWFDTVNQFHGVDEREGLTFSVRVDGRFTEEIRRSIPWPSASPASAPALWACGAGPFMDAGLQRVSKFHAAPNR